jgi:hypothetical protein
MLRALREAAWSILGSVTAVTDTTDLGHCTGSATPTADCRRLLQ